MNAEKRDTDARDPAKRKGRPLRRPFNGDGIREWNTTVVEKNVSSDDRTYVSDWNHTHEISRESTYYNGHLDPKNYDNVMYCKNYRDFDEQYKNYQWWQDKKYWIQKTIRDFYGKDPALKAKAEAQTKVQISFW